MKLRPFTKEDYFGFDPEKPDNSEPMICFDTIYQGHNVVVICDKAGLSICWCEDDPSKKDATVDNSYVLNCSFAVACWICDCAICNTIPQSLISIMEKIL